MNGLSTSRRERGQVVVIFALMIPVFLALGGFVIGIGNWYTHAKHLQTKADAGAFAGGGSWEFPCGPQIDARIEAQARLYAGTNNPQVGGVPDTSIHTVLNGNLWYDDDSNRFPIERNDPLNPSVCSAMILDVKVTEDNSFPLFSLIPLFPDIKRKARVEIQEAEGISGLLPIAVRAPEPVSAAAVFYNEANGNILGVKYFVKANGIFGIPGGLQGWSSYNSEDSSTWANFSPAATTGVAIAISFRGACNTNLPSPNTKITTQGAPCFEDSSVTFPTVNQLCNQGGSTQIVNCYYATGTWPNESVQSGLHFIRGYGTGTVGNAPPQVRSAYLENVSCLVSGVAGTPYFNAHPNNSCQARVHVAVDLGSVIENPPPNPPNNNVETRVASNVQVRYGIKRADGSTFCPTMNAQCDLLPGNPNGTGVVTYSSAGTASSPHALFTANSRENALAVEISVKSSTVVPNPGNCGVGLSGYSPNCRWFHVGSGISSTSVNPVSANNGAAALASPIQQAFRGNSVYSSSVQWLRLTTDQDCNGVPEFIDQEAASQPTGGNRCFFMDMGLKGGIAKDANEQPILFNDGAGSNQMGAVDCDPAYSGQGQELILGVINGCAPWYAKNPFDWTPLCPPANSIFATPNPGPPWDDGRWPPLRCIKTRQTGSMNQLERGLDTRLFGSNNAPCPATGPGFVKGRNYWDKDTPNGYTGVPPLGYQELPTQNTRLDPNDPRIVTIFVAPTEAFIAAPNKTYPIAGFIEVYITGYGRIQGNGSVQIDDPCPGNALPTDLDLSGGNNSGRVIWGHILNYALPSANATPSGVLCNPGGSTQPCVPVLVE